MWNLVAIGCVASAVMYFTKKRFAGGKCKCTTRLDGKVVIITGANSGLGKATALDLAKRGAHVVLACRNLIDAEKTQKWIFNCTGNESVSVIHLDLNSFKSIRHFVEEFKQGKLINCHQKLYALVNNAGVFYYPKSLTADGFDVTFQTNYIGPFYLTYLLLDILKESAPSRVVNVASNSHRLVTELDLTNDKFDLSLDHFQAYGQSKLCLILFTYKLAEILSEFNISADSVDPGNVETNIFRHFPFLSNPILFALQKPIRLLVVKTPQEGAQSVIHALLWPIQDAGSAKYFCDCKESQPSDLAMSKDLMDKLWIKSLKWCGIESS